MEPTEEKALARIQIGELDYYKTDEGMRPFYKCLVITTAGQIWNVNFDAFQCTEEAIRKKWNEDRSGFVKREQS